MTRGFLLFLAAVCCAGLAGASVPVAAAPSGGANMSADALKLWQQTPVGR